MMRAPQTAHFLKEIPKSRSNQPDGRRLHESMNQTPVFVRTLKSSLQARWIEQYVRIVVESVKPTVGDGDQGQRTRSASQVDCAGDPSRTLPEGLGERFDLDEHVPAADPQFRPRYGLAPEIHYPQEAMAEDRARDQTRHHI